ncbi:MAG: SUMF1/EgtB/PvdO family nonheme iron enzyme [Myxococcota bacterium]
MPSAGFGPAAWRPQAPFTLDGQTADGSDSGRFRADAEIGLVATGAVFAGRDQVADKPVAILLFHPALFAGPRRDVQRARLLRALTYEHAHIAPTYAVGDAFGTCFVATAPIVGQPLTHWRRDVGRIGVSDVYRVMGQLIEGVAAIHAAGGVHGSLSPDTLRIVQDQAWVVNPWTLDIPADVPPGELPPPRTSWLAPELLFPAAIQGAETDVYGLGLALGYLLACGLTEPGHSLLVQGIDVPPAVDDVSVRATARQRESRYRDLAELSAALEAAAGYEWRDAQKVLPKDGAVRALAIEVLESRPVAPPMPREASFVGPLPTVLESRPTTDIESTAEDEAIPAFPDTAPQPGEVIVELAPLGPVATVTPSTLPPPTPPPAPSDSEGHGGFNDAVSGVPRVGRRKLAKTLVGGSPHTTGPHERPMPALPAELRPRPGEPTIEVPAATPASERATVVVPAASHGSLESLDGGAIAPGGPPPLPPATPAYEAPVATAPPLPPLPPALPSYHAPVESHEPTIVEPFAPSLLELDLFGVARSGPPAPPADPFLEPPPPTPNEWSSDSPFAVTHSEGPSSDIFATARPEIGGNIDRPFTEPTISAGALALKRPDAPITRSKVERPPAPVPAPLGSLRSGHSFVGSVPPTRKRRFPWAVALAVLAGVVVAIAIFSSGGSPKGGEADGGSTVAVAGIGQPTSPSPIGVTPADERDASQAGAASDALATDVAPDVAQADVAPDAIEDAADAVEDGADAVEDAADVAPDVVPDVASDVAPDTGFDTWLPDAEGLDVLLGVNPPLEDVALAVADAAVADSAVADTTEADTAVADTAVAPADAVAPGDFVPKDPAKLSCPGGMAKMKKKIQVVLADGSKADDWEVVCIDLYEYPGAGAPPTTGVDISGARGACIGRSKRLCTRAEWRRACGGTYPYGQTYDAEKCATAHDDGSPGSVVAAGSKKGCRSPSGAYDMVGNVAEWTSDGTVNGGSAFKNGADGTCNTGSKRAGGAPYVGFRCCTDAK